MVFQGYVALVTIATIASSGIGLATANAFAVAGCAVTARSRYASIPQSQEHHDDRL
jgi:NAD(P)-dependent dehydrogenase (short-subunit alcohol dehydrogenase family)